MGIVALLLYLLGIHMAYYGYEVALVEVINEDEEFSKLSPWLRDVLFWVFVIGWPLAELISLVTMKNNKE